MLSIGSSQIGKDAAMLVSLFNIKFEFYLPASLAHQRLQVLLRLCTPGGLPCFRGVNAREPDFFPLVIDDYADRIAIIYFNNADEVVTDCFSESKGRSSTR